MGGEQQHVLHCETHQMRSRRICGLGRGQLRTQPSLNAFLYINSILNINHNILRTILWVINYQRVNTKSFLEDLEGMTNKPQLTVCHASNAKEHVHGTAPLRTLASPHGSLVLSERPPKAQLWLSLFPNHWLFLQHLGQGSPLLLPFPNPHCRVGPLEEKISSDLLPTCSFAMSPKLVPLHLSGRRCYSTLSLDINSPLKLYENWLDWAGGLLSQAPILPWFWNRKFSWAVLQRFWNF